MPVDAAGQGNLLLFLSAHGMGEGNFGQIGLHGQHPTARRQGPDVHHQHLVLGKLLNLRHNSNQLDKIKIKKNTINKNKN